MILELKNFVFKTYHKIIAN